MIGLYKAEVIHRRGPWRGVEAVEFATLDWVDWFNNRRLLEPIGYMPPAEAEACYYAQSSGLAMGGVTHTKTPPENPGRFSAAVRGIWDRLAATAIGHWAMDNGISELRLAGRIQVNPRQAAFAVGHSVDDAAKGTIH